MATLTTPDSPVRDGDQASPPRVADPRAELVAVGTSWASNQHRLIALAVALDRSGDWAHDGSRSPAHWIAAALDIEICTAREWLRCGHALQRLPHTALAFDHRELSFSKVRALTRIATPDTEAELLEIAHRVSAGSLAHALATWLARHEDPDDQQRRHHRDRSVTCRIEPDGMVTGTYRLPPLDGATFIATLETTALRDPERARTTGGGEHATADASSTPRPTLNQQRADALITLVRDGGSRVTTEVVLHVRGDGCTFDDGTPIPRSVVEHIAPEAFIRVLIHDAQRRPVNASGRQRRPTLRQQRVVKERDRTCVDCGTTAFLEHDHVPSYDASQHTLIDELELRCSGCHRRRHRRE